MNMARIISLFLSKTTVDENHTPQCFMILAAFRRRENLREKSKNIPVTALSEENQIEDQEPSRICHNSKKMMKTGYDWPPGNEAREIGFELIEIREGWPRDLHAVRVPVSNVPAPNSLFGIERK